MSVDKLLWPEHLTPKELKVLMDKGVQMCLLDVRHPWEIELCHLDNYQSIPLDQLAGRYEELPKELPIVTICHHGIRGQQAALFLKQHGFKNVANLKGGLDVWAQQIDPSMPTY